MSSGVAVIRQLGEVLPPAVEKFASDLQTPAMACRDFAQYPGRLPITLQC